MITGTCGWAGSKVQVGSTSINSVGIDSKKNCVCMVWAPPPPMVAMMPKLPLVKRPTLRHHGWRSRSAMSASVNCDLSPIMAPALVMLRVTMR